MTHKQIITEKIRKILFELSDVETKQFSETVNELTEFVALVQKETQEHTLGKLIEVEQQKWDAEHCSCLRHAIWQLMGEPDDKEFLKRMGEKK